MNKNEILIDLSESEQTRFGKEDFHLQSIPQKVFSSVWAVESEVNNGGFSQYFQNSSAETAPFVVEALDTIGAPHTARICNRAISSAFPAGLPANPDDISLTAGSLPDDMLKEFELLAGEFMEYPHNLTDLLFAYVSKHPEEFGPVPDPTSAP
jgi:hypothetical protein